MKKIQIIIIMLFVFSLITLSACNNSNGKINDKENIKSVASEDIKSDNDVPLADSTSKDDEDNEQKEGNDANEEAIKDESLNVENKTESIDKIEKEMYLDKLNKMENEDRFAEVGTTTVELVEQETERYKKWDIELNKIYGMLKSQLSKEKMVELTKEQLKWIEERDEMAKESSLKYEGGSYEALEYVATQAELTKERSYLLVAKYME